ncbi:ATP-grasp domain-containing protein [Candidatus Binatia bacterium]|nr:ATP-grasp domain-containing protein [Candidatus Binatia bacterium]
MRRIRRVLVANRGEIALRIMRTCRAMGIETAAVFAAPDRHSPFVRTADAAVDIGAPVTGSSFLAIDKIVDAARRVGADAIHPGYGFLAENANFAQACLDAGLIFIGPTPEAIRQMGSKIASKELMVAAGVPTIPGFSAAGLSDADIAATASAIGFPVLVKASAGGGGKGMRVVHESDRLEAALAAARREATHAFGDDTLLVERYFEAPRHVEIQVLGDAHGNIVHCFERECSIQRRYQKIIEEAPSPALDSTLRARMGAAAVAAGRAIRYRNAGTVEFILDRDRNFYFLEMNTRLQVEHPVTEEITGLDLVRLQIEIAEGAPLPFRQEDLSFAGHAIECRVYAEDPANDFLPSTGTIACWEEAAIAGVRYESGVATGSQVTIHYDPMLAKVIACAPSRTEAARRLVWALRRTRVHGVQTNIPFLIRSLEHPEFLAGNLSTHFIGDHLGTGGERTAEDLAMDRSHALAAALWLQARRRARAPVLATIPSGWRNNPSQMQEVRFTAGPDVAAVEYRLRAHGAVEARVDGTEHQVIVHSTDDDGIAMEVDGLHRRYRVVSRELTHYVSSALGSSTLHELARFPVAEREEVHGGCRAPMPGRILVVRVEPGAVVEKGAVLVVLEAMKMEHEVTAPETGTVQEVMVAPGQQVEAGDILVVVGSGTAAAS